MSQKLDDVTPSHRAYPGQAVYTTAFLRIYDPFVLGLSNRFVYRCPSAEVLRLYDRHISGRHLDIGPGSGYFLDRCPLPTDAPELTLVDLNPSVLAYASHRLRRYAPRTLQADVLQPLPLPQGYADSIALHYVLHCLPGSMQEKIQILPRLAELLTPGGVLFGSTALGRGVQYGRLGRRAMRTYNARGILSNADDGIVDLRQGLEASFTDVDVRVRGTVALFSARR